MTRFHPPLGAKRRPPARLRLAMASAFIILGALGVAMMVADRWAVGRTTSSEVPPSSTAAPTDRAVTAPVLPLSPAPERLPSSDGGLTHVDPQKRAEMLRTLLALLRPETDGGPDSDGAPTQGAAAGPRRFRTTNDLEVAIKYIQERIRNDFVPLAKQCYGDFLRRKPEAEGDVLVGFEILGDESVGGVVNSAEIRNESTLRDESFETCLRESFLSVYFDPPPAGASATIKYPFHFAHGDVDGSHELHLRDRRGEQPPPKP